MRARRRMAAGPQLWGWCRRAGTHERRGGGSRRWETLCDMGRTFNVPAGGRLWTSWHPREAGVQLPLMELLIERGAIIDGPDGGSAVTDSLHNGRGEAAELFAKHGARLDLEGAAGVGRLDVVRSFFNDDG